MGIEMITFLQVFGVGLLIFGVQTVVMLSIDKSCRKSDERDIQRHKDLLTTNGFGN